MKKVFLVLLITYSIVCTGYIIYLKSPLNDHGHRLYGVKNPKTMLVLDSIFRDVANLHRDLVFKVGPSTQAIYDNGRVGLNYISDSTVDLPLSGPSFVVSNPEESAQKAARILTRNGFNARIIVNFDSTLSNKLVLLQSNSINWTLVFRRDILNMGKKPKDIGFGWAK
ncbi:MAG: hypothetical protein KGI58_01555 [Patescibacteria group bacterium]|nr:hypothetical protein [Patescibacteria group bacterium]